MRDDLALASLAGVAAVSISIHVPFRSIGSALETEENALQNYSTHIPIKKYCTT
jgi:hypothetical protein